MLKGRPTCRGEMEVAPAFVRISTGRDLYVGARATFAVSDTLNLYAKGGYTNARIKGARGDGTATISDTDIGDRIRGGIGAQLNLAKHISWLNIVTQTTNSAFRAIKQWWE